MSSVVEALAEAGRELAEAGISPSTSGNLSVRNGDRVFITGTGADLGGLDASSIAEVGTDGVHHGGPRASKELPIHLAMYERNPEHAAVVHVHSPSAVAVACLPPWATNSAVPPLTPYFVMRVGQAPLISYRAPGDPQLGTLIACHPLPFRATLLANHGQVTSGSGLREALHTAVELEQTCRVALLTRGHEPEVLDEAAIGELTRRNGTAWEIGEQ